MAKEEAIQVQGKVVAALANTQFRVRLDTGHEIIAHIAGKIRQEFHPHPAGRYRHRIHLAL